MTYTEKELDQFLHGISLSLLSKKSAQHWRYDEETAKEIEWLEVLERKVRADKADRKTEPQTRTDEDGRVWEYRNGNWWQLGKTEPSTEATTGLPGPCIGCLKEICAGCDFQKAKEAWRKSQADCAWK